MRFLVKGLAVVHVDNVYHPTLVGPLGEVFKNISYQSWRPVAVLHARRQKSPILMLMASEVCLYGRLGRAFDTESTIFSLKMEDGGVLK